MYFFTNFGHFITSNGNTKGGDPLGFYDWNILLQLGWGLLESGALFGLTAAAMDYCFRRGIITKFRG